ncbi:MAG: elongation factor P maturation arginine rhamnosyltransferase EarP [Gallionellaceae bacterium]|jgi:uncharacterized repeat protein (TIGR03837 family)
MPSKSISYVDIFCAVVDNYGDIGVSWRLARHLANEHGIRVRLWVDDLRSFNKLCAEINVDLAEQYCRGVLVLRWADSAFTSLSDVSALAGSEMSISSAPTDLVIEAFACKLPEAYVLAMAAQHPPPVWINLEYLSAEDWVAGCHRLPSPHPTLPLTKYFFFPGFTPETGGLLLEHDLLARRDKFQADLSAQNVFWQRLGVPERKPRELRISLFCYENSAATDLLKAWSQGDFPVVCCVPQGRVVGQVAEFFGRSSAQAGDSWRLGNLQVFVLPFVEQERYDELLWSCDINFVRGEDSCVRAQWAGKPFVWHIYPQHDGIHMQKLPALAGLYGEELPKHMALANENCWLAWNGEGDIISAWNSFIEQRVDLEQHAKAWSAKLSGNKLALNLLDFCREVGRIRAFEN